MFLLFQNSEYSKKSQRIFIALFVAYLAIGTGIVALDLGVSPWCRSISNVGRFGIPSINGTAEITSAPDSAAAVLSIAWLWGGVIYMPMAWSLFATSGRVVNWDHWRRLSGIIRVGLLSFALTGVYVFAHMVPIDSAGMEGIIFNLLAFSPIYTVLWGITIWATVWIGLLMLSIGLIGFVKKFN